MGYVVETTQKTRDELDQLIRSATDYPMEVMAHLDVAHGLLCSVRALAGPIAEGRLDPAHYLWRRNQARILLLGAARELGKAIHAMPAQDRTWGGGARPYNEIVDDMVDEYQRITDWPDDLPADGPE